MDTILVHIRQNMSGDVFGTLNYGGLIVAVEPDIESVINKLTKDLIEVCGLAYGSFEMVFDFQSVSGFDLYSDNKALR